MLPFHCHWVPKSQEQIPGFFLHYFDPCRCLLIGLFWNIFVKLFNYCNCFTELFCVSTVSLSTMSPLKYYFCQTKKPSTHYWRMDLWSRKLIKIQTSMFTLIWFMCNNFFMKISSLKNICNLILLSSSVSTENLFCSESLWLVK